MLITLLGLPVTYVFFNLNHVMRATGYPKSHGLHPSFRRNQHHPGSHLHLLVQMGHYRSSRGHPSRPGRRHGARAVTLSDAASTVHFRRGIWQLRKTIVTGILSIGMAPCLVNVCGSAVTVAINRQLADHGGTWPSGPTASSTAFLFCSPCSSSASLRECSPSSATTTEP